MITMTEKQKAEAAKRMELMGIREDVRRKFEEENTIMICDNGQYRPFDEETAVKIREFEQGQNDLVFLVVRLSYLDSLLFVSRYENEWESQRNDLKAGYDTSYTINRCNPDCSEFGDIFFRVTEDGAVVRES